MFRTLYAKLAATLTILILALGAVFYMMIRSTFESQQLAVTQRLNRDVAERLVVDFFSDHPADEASDKAAFDRLMRVNPQIEVYRLDAGGRILSFYAPEGHVVRSAVDLAPIRRFLRDDAEFPLRGDDPRDLRRRKIFSAAPVGTRKPGDASGFLYVVIGGELQDMLAEGGQADAFRSAVAVMLAALALVLLIGFAVFRLLTRRLERLSLAMETFRADGFTRQVAYPLAAGRRPGDEIDRLGATYNAMGDHILSLLQALRAGDAQRRDLIANVSHDLRTPLTALRGYLDTLLLKGAALSDEQRTVHLRTAARQSERLAHLVTEFFELAKLDARDLELSTEPVMLAELVQDVLQGFRIAAEERSVALQMQRHGAITEVEGDIRLLERLLANLVDNALRHTPAGGRVDVGLDDAPDGMARMTVTDTGDGIPADALARIFEHSFTLDRSRSGESGGSGLGLSIVKRIVDLHHGRIRVDSRVGEGTRFVVELPAAAPFRPDGSRDG
ncbi:MAG TPA: ATP-binding protein [Burkholderiaceae bacterium]|nr:ATP-binding protein [Burkholderiaceae bacterium]